MSTLHQLGGKRAKGLARLSPARRQKIARQGGHACVCKNGRAHMAKIGKKGALARNNGRPDAPKPPR